MATAEAGRVTYAIASRSNPQSLADSINSSLPSPLVKAFSVDATSSSSVSQFVADASKAWPDAKPHVGVWNPTVGFGFKPFLKWTEAEVREAFEGQVIGAFTFTQSLLQIFLDSPLPSSPLESRGVLLYTGATSSLRGSLNFSGFAAAKSGLRSLIQSVAREHGKDGVHVAHFVIDGVIDTQRVKGFLGEAEHPEDRLDPDHIAAEYTHVANQPRSTWTHEVDVRPAREKF
ncbi:17 beta-hydroxysteroid dehydrogenase type 3, HSD17B3 [Ceraceosorus bombacis]|uniref:17 beta-hydroxysteroid dehydrogenase type 3, HSD17B3 n=1 Tax=Ceraceosorus bombacis TaxID=401625 RepID=A0A0P1BD42_9BASI|nr:17 beta-hydroxysteroid dehydrogenase type 3, HSD17B3 [Ceraceosorus bombacis]